MGLKGRRLFAISGGNGGGIVTTRDVNDFLAEASGDEVTAKDFRAFKASATALAILTQHDMVKMKRVETKRWWKPPTRRVSFLSIQGVWRSPATSIPKLSVPIRLAGSNRHC